MLANMVVNLRIYHKEIFLKIKILIINLNTPLINKPKNNKKCCKIYNKFNKSNKRMIINIFPKKAQNNNKKRN